MFNHFFAPKQYTLPSSLPSRKKPLNLPGQLKVDPRRNHLELFYQSNSFGTKRLQFARVLELVWATVLNKADMVRDVNDLVDALELGKVVIGGLESLGTAIDAGQVRAQPFVVRGAQGGGSLRRDRGLFAESVARLGIGMRAKQDLAQLARGKAARAGQSLRQFGQLLARGGIALTATDRRAAGLGQRGLRQPRAGLCRRRPSEPRAAARCHGTEQLLGLAGG